MCGNRVEELEGRVKELQATVDGLTDELVECKVRIRELENAVDDDTGFDPEDQDIDHAAEPEEGTDVADNTNTEDAETTDEHQSEEESDTESDIIIA